MEKMEIGALIVSGGRHTSQIAHVVGETKTQWKAVRDGKEFRIAKRSCKEVGTYSNSYWYATDKAQEEIGAANAAFYAEQERKRSEGKVRDEAKEQRARELNPNVVYEQTAVPGVHFVELVVDGDEGVRKVVILFRVEDARIYDYESGAERDVVNLRIAGFSVDRWGGSSFSDSVYNAPSVVEGLVKFAAHFH